MTVLDPTQIFNATSTAPLHMPDDPEAGTSLTCQNADLILREVAMETTIGAAFVSAHNATHASQQEPVIVRHFPPFEGDRTCSYCC